MPAVATKRPSGLNATPAVARSAAAVLTIIRVAMSHPGRCCCLSVVKTAASRRPSGLIAAVTHSPRRLGLGGCRRASAGHSPTASCRRPWPGEQAAMPVEGDGVDLGANPPLATSAPDPPLATGCSRCCCSAVRPAGSHKSHRAVLAPRCELAAWTQRQRPHGRDVPDDHPAGRHAEPGGVPEGDPCRRRRRRRVWPSRLNASADTVPSTHHGGRGGLPVSRSTSTMPLRRAEV